MSVLLLTGCASTRSTSSTKVQEFKAESAESRDSSRVENLVERDTLREVTTITVQMNDRGDTLRLTQITERDRIRDASQLKAESVRLKVEHDTVYVERRDSVEVSSSKFQGSSGEGSKSKGGFVVTLKWIFAVICAIIGLIITVKVCLRKVL